MNAKIKKDFIERLRKECPTPIIPIPDKDRPPKETYLKPVDVFYGMDVIPFTRDLATEIVTVGTEPTLLLSPPHPRVYIIYNPARIAAPDYAIINLFDGETDSAGDTTADPIGVTGYKNCHLHLTVRSITGTWKFAQLALDPYTSEWAEVQVFRTVDSAGTYYNFFENFGIVTDLAFKWYPETSGTINFALTITLKEGVGGIAVERTVYLGGRNVTVDTGYPLLESQKVGILPAQNLEIWAVAKIETPVKIYRL